MPKRVKWSVASATLAAAILSAGALVATGSATSGAGGPGQNDGGSAEGPSNGGDCSAHGGGSVVANGMTVTDESTGQTYNVQWQASEFGSSCRGQTFFQLNGPSITACDVHGPAMAPGVVPLTAVQCGGSFGITVKIDGCRANVETHGAVHADSPWTVYLGPMTLDVAFEYNPREGSGRLAIAIYTPKSVLEIAGTTNGPVIMPSCT